MSNERKELKIKSQTVISVLFPNVTENNTIHTGSSVLVTSESDYLTSGFCHELAKDLAIYNDFENESNGILYLNYIECIDARLRCLNLSGHYSVRVASVKRDLEDTIVDTVDDLLEMLCNNKNPTVLFVDGLIFKPRVIPDFEPLLTYCSENDILLIVSNVVKDGLDISSGKFTHHARIPSGDTL